MSERRRHGFHVYHPSRQRAILQRLRGEKETPEDARLIAELITELDELLKARKRRRRLPSERKARRAQRSLFRRSLEPAK